MKGLFTRLENFPKIPKRDAQKLCDLADLLLEIEAAKEESYLDTARGIHPIPEKLSYNLQDKWTPYGSRYKEEYQVSSTHLLFSPSSSTMKLKLEMTRVSSLLHPVTLLPTKSFLVMVK